MSQIFTYTYIIDLWLKKKKEKIKKKRKHHNQTQVRLVLVQKIKKQSDPSHRDPTFRYFMGRLQTCHDPKNWSTNKQITLWRSLQWDHMLIAVDALELVTPECTTSNDFSGEVVPTPTSSHVALKKEKPKVHWASFIWVGVASPKLHSRLNFNLNYARRLWGVVPPLMKYIIV